jgi:hypothetical protein
MREAALDVCHGWAYEPCGRPAVWVVHEESLTERYWSEYGVCRVHAAAILDGVGQETDRCIRTWWELADYAKFVQKTVTLG